MVYREDPLQRIVNVSWASGVAALIQITTWDDNVHGYARRDSDGLVANPGGGAGTRDSLQLRLQLSSSFEFGGETFPASKDFVEGKTLTDMQNATIKGVDSEAEISFADFTTYAVQDTLSGSFFNERFWGGATNPITIGPDAYTEYEKSVTLVYSDGAIFDFYSWTFTPNTQGGQAMYDAVAAFTDGEEGRVTWPG